MDSSKESQTVTANTTEELNSKVQKEIIEKGWQTDGPVIKNTNGTFSQKMVR